VSGTANAEGTFGSNVPLYVPLYEAATEIEAGQFCGKLWRWLLRCLTEDEAVKRIVYEESGRYHFIENRLHGVHQPLDLGMKEEAEQADSVLPLGLRDSPGGSIIENQRIRL